MKSLNTKYVTLNALVFAALVVGVGMGCKPRPQQPGGANNPKAAAARTQAETYVVDAVKGAASAQEQIAKSNGAGGALTSIVPKNLPNVPVNAPVPPSSPSPESSPWVSAGSRPQAAPASSPKTLPSVVIREKVSTEVPYPTEARADEQAILAAQERVRERLEALDPPIHYKPSLAVVKNEYVRKDTRNVRRPSAKEQERWADAGYAGDQVYVDYDVEVTADQVRELRTQERLGGMLRFFGGIAAVALAGFLFLRLDDWTKGYLTSWLAFLAAGMVGGVAAALWLV
jgi:hypothetical protein